jgi:hypothetical protein
MAKKTNVTTTPIQRTEIGPSILFNIGHLL